VVFTEQVIEMAASPVRALVEKPESSIVKGLEALHAGQIDGFASAGNTGAMLAGAVLKLGSIREDIRFAEQGKGDDARLLQNWSVDRYTIPRDSI
jgi:fatty acid/phospholipid biosynthesis enzyme